MTAFQKTLSFFMVATAVPPSSLCYTVFVFDDLLQMKLYARGNGRLSLILTPPLYMAKRPSRCG
ncbi:MAG: hypothetical protein GY805_03305 [Chloroflexi bacterium]|nr:hypothetical protein [Chloroflexota bacterium]